MRLLVPSILVLSVGSGCVPEDPDALGDPETVTVSYAIKGPGGVPAACPPGFDTLMLEATELIGLTGFQLYIPCTPEGTHDFSLFTRGVQHVETENGDYFIKAHEMYEIRLSVTDATGTLVRVSSFAQHLDLSNGPKSVSFEIYPDAGFGAINWGFESTLTENRITTCAAANVDTMQYRYHLYPVEDTEPFTVLEWPCVIEGVDKDDDIEGQALTPALVPDDYVGTLHAFRGGAEVASSPEFYLHIMGSNDLYEAGSTIAIPDR